MNKMKKCFALSVSIFFLVVVGGFFGLLAGCSNLLETEKPTPFVITVDATSGTSPQNPSTGDADNGTVIAAPTTPFTGEGIRVFLVLPFSEKNDSVLARSAAPSSAVFGSGANSLIFAGAIHASGAAATLREAAYTPESGGTPASVVVPFDVSTTARENYVLDIYAFASGYDHSSGFDAGDALLFGQAASVDIPANAYSVGISDSVKMKPYSGSSVNGSVELAVSIPTGYSLACDNSNFSCTTTSIAAASIAPGEYNVTFSITKDDTPVYVWSEMIYVYPGIKTDTWNTGTDASGAREISSVTIESTFFVRGDGGSWIAGITSAAGNDTDGNGSLGKPYATIQKAIERIKATTTAAADSYTIYVDGTFTASGSTPVADFSAIQSGCSITLKGLDATAKATLDGNNTAQGIVANGASTNLNLTLENLIITKCTAERGGGIFLVTETANTHTISNCEISNNTATSGAGGGVYNHNGNLTLESGTISGNTATNGGGGGIYNNGTFTMDGGTISGNRAATSGGGIYNKGGTVTMNGGTISDNEATSQGGGIYNSSGTFTMSGGTIGDEAAPAFASESACSNKAKNGGGIYNDGGTVTLVGGNIFYNYATYGGGIFNSSSANSELVMGSGCTTTIKYNCANYNGGGIYNYSTFTMNGGTIGGNSATQSGGGIYTNGTLELTGGEISGNTAATNGVGGGIYNTGTLNFSGDAAVDSNNAVYLVANKFITITDSLTGTNVATITPASYTAGTKVLEAANATLLSASIEKFSLPSTATNYAIAQDDTSDATKTNAVIVDNTPRTTVYLDAAIGSDLNDGS